MDYVFIEGLEIDCTIGIYDWEKAIKQKLVLDIEMAHDNKKPAHTDNIADALDYEAVSHTLIHYLETTPIELVERVAEEVARILQNQFAIPWLKVRVRKPDAIKVAKSVGVCIERGVRPL